MTRTWLRQGRWGGERVKAQVLAKVRAQLVTQRKDRGHTASTALSQAQDSWISWIGAREAGLEGKMMNLSLYVLNWKDLQYITPEQQKDVEDWQEKPRVWGEAGSRLTNLLELSSYESQEVTCLKSVIAQSSRVTLFLCVFQNLHRLTHIPSGKCLDRSEVLHQVFISDCDSSKMTQKWEINNIHSV